MMRISPFELLMGAALIAMGIGVVVPRLAQADPAMRASQANLLENRLQREYAQLRLSHIAQTQNYDSEDSVKMTQQLLSKLPVAQSWSCAHAAEHCQFVDAQGCSHNGVVFNGEFAVAFDGASWHVALTH